MILILTRYYTLEISSDVIFPKYINFSPQKEDIQNAYPRITHMHIHIYIYIIRNLVKFASPCI